MNKVGVSPSHSDIPKESEKSNGDDTQEDILKRKDSNTLAPNDNYQNAFENIERDHDFNIQNFESSIQNFAQNTDMDEVPSSSQRIVYQSKKVTTKVHQPKKRATRAYQTKKFVDIEEMLSDDSDRDSFIPKSIIPNSQMMKNVDSMEEEKDVVLPLPSKKSYQKAMPKKASNIKMKRITKKTTYQTQETFNSSGKPNSNDDFLRMDSNFGNILNNNNNQAQQFQSSTFANVKSYEPKVGRINRFRPQSNDKNNFSENPFARAFKERLNPADPVINKPSESEVKEKNVFENVKYGSSITLNIMPDEGTQYRKLNSKLRISDKINATKMEEDEYNINTLFKLIPSSQHIMQDKILNIIEKDEIPSNIEIEYENFINEVESNAAANSISTGTPVKYEDSFQLYQDSSKRYVCFYSCKVDEIKSLFKNTYSDSNCYYLGFSEYPGDNTHFSFATVANYQQEEDGSVKKYHYVYLTIFEKGKTHYLYNIGKT